MSFEPVDIHVQDQFGDPVEGVTVGVYDPTGATYYTGGVTDATGVASFLLETLSYSMRFYKFHTNFYNPQLFDVLAAPETNVFDAKAEIFVLPVAQDSRLCRCSGFFRDLDGSPKRYLDIHIISQFDPILLDDAAVISEERHLRTDEKGYAQIDLIRGAMYWARVESLGAAMPSPTSTDLRCISVPDQPSANLPDLLLPIVARVNFTPIGPYALAVGTEVELGVEVYDSAGVLLVGAATSDVQWKSSDPNVLAVMPSGSTIKIRGVAAGTAQIIAERLNTSIIKIPNLAIAGQPAEVQVT